MGFEFGPEYETVQKVIKQRQTFKVLGNVQQPPVLDSQLEQRNRALVLDAIATADWAPFHYDRAAESIPQPWRVHVLWPAACRKIATEMPNWFSDIKPGNKLPAMLSACGALVLVNWLPQFSFGAQPNSTSAEIAKEKQVQVDEEHLMATSAMVQNLLLLLTAAGMGTYWSSGGQFRTPEMFKRLQIDESQRLVAAVFVEFPEQRVAELERLPGKHRNNRGSSEVWLREIESLS